jgi:hypothetical protein
MILGGAGVIYNILPAKIVNLVNSEVGKFKYHTISQTEVLEVASVASELI